MIIYTENHNEPDKEIKKKQFIIQITPTIHKYIKQIQYFRKYPNFIFQNFQVQNDQRFYVDFYGIVNKLNILYSFINFVYVEGHTA